MIYTDIMNKICSKCKTTKEIQFFYKDKRSVDGFRSQCKFCHLSYCKPKPRKIKPINILPNDVKICSKCKEMKNIDLFYKDPKRKDGLKSQCKTCHLFYTKTSNVDRLIKRKKYLKEYRQRPETKERYKNYRKTEKYKKFRREYVKIYKDTPQRKKWEKAHKKTQKYKERRKSYGIEYRKKNPEKFKIRDHKRRALKQNAPGEYTIKDIRSMEIVQENKCYYCNSNFSLFISEKCKKGYHIEHKIPLSRGGTNWPSNLCLSCPHCNFTKNIKTEEMFLNYLHCLAHI